MSPRKDLPDTIQRSPRKAQRTFEKAMESAEQEYGKGERAGRTAYGALKHSFEKVGDHWEPKDGRGPSDSKSAGSRDYGRSAGGVDVRGHSKAELYERAKKLDVGGRSTMNKEELAEAIARKQN
jgi:cation transport regulator ChaB